MGESSKHIQLVELLVEKISSIEDIDDVLLLADLPDRRKDSPPTINGYKADVYYDFNGVFIIGEAKTKDDLLSKHTEKQLETYVNMCANFNGKSSLYVAVPWTENATAKNLLKKIIKKLGVSITFFIIDEL